MTLVLIGCCFFLKGQSTVETIKKLNPASVFVKSCGMGLEECNRSNTELCNALTDHPKVYLYQCVGLYSAMFTFTNTGAKQADIWGSDGVQQLN